MLLWPLLFGLGLYLLLTAQPLGRPKPDLAERLRRLDVDERIRSQVTRRDGRPMFVSRTLELLLRPALEDGGRALQALLGRFGLGGGAVLERKLRLARPGIEPSQFFGEKVAAGLIGLGLFPLMNALGIQPFGPWPAWLWGAGFGFGFLAPDWQLEARLAARRTLAVMELPALLDMLTICASAGVGLEQALELVVRQSAGVVARELRDVTREVALGQRTLIEGLEAMAARNAFPELVGRGEPAAGGARPGVAPGADAGHPGRRPARAEALAHPGGRGAGQRAHADPRRPLHPAGAVRRAARPGRAAADCRWEAEPED